MADPLSFVASVIAVATLAETVVTKSYQYLKAVKNCPDEVRNLLVEVNVLCGILGRLVVLLRSTESNPNTTQNTAKGTLADSDDNDEEDEESLNSHENEYELKTAQALEPPPFIYECQKILSEIENILNSFAIISDPSSSSDGRSSRLKLSGLRRLDAKNLKWPLAKSRTLQLIQTLERHKSTCIVALAKDSLITVHAVLEQTKISNRHLIELKAKQEKMLEICITQEQVKALRWLSPVDPAAKLQAFRRERQRGTGIWLFDLPEMSHWLDNSKDALWIYGIPGAGKTILSTLVVDEIFFRKRSNSVGTAYFYIRHDDTESHKPWSVLGSLIAQLARQNSRALANVMELYTTALTDGRLATVLDGEDLDQLLYQVLQSFECIYIMIDGLDECGSVFDSYRKRLINTVSKLHRIGECSVRTLVFSRDEHDIRKQLSATGFHTVSVAATSADLRLFANAWLPSLEIESESLKIEIVDGLVEQANGMFMWVRAQIDYLQRLPSDIEKQRALEHLPPDLPQTYIRIFQTIESSYPEPTKKLIQQLLKCLVLSVELQRYPNFGRPPLTIATLRQAICIENEYDWPSGQTIPTSEHIFRWLGCLIRKSGEDGTVQFSHFTVREFLTMNPKEIQSSNIHEYLVSPTDNELLKICFRCLTHDHFKKTVLHDEKETKLFLSDNPSYGYFATQAYQILCSLDDDKIELEFEYLLQRFLPSATNTFLDLCTISMLSTRINESLHFLQLSSPLHVASYAGLANQVKRLLKEGVDPNLPNATLDADLTSLHLAIIIGSLYYLSVIPGTFVLDPYMGVADATNKKQQQRGLRVSKSLLAFNANIDRQLLLKIQYEGVAEGPRRFTAMLTPLVLAVICRNYEIATLLLSRGADWNAIAAPSRVYDCDLCSIGNLLAKMPDVDHMVERVVEVSGHIGVKEALGQWRALHDTSDGSNPQTLFIEAFQREDWKTVEELLETQPDIDINYIDGQGENAIFSASLGPETTLRYLLEHGANPNALLPSGKNPLCRATSEGYIGNMKLLLEFSADIEHRAPGGWTPLLYAAYHQQYDALQILLESGANVNATLDEGSNALLVEGVIEDETLFTLLLTEGTDPNIADHYSRLALHEACHKGLESQVDRLCSLATNTFDSINQNDVRVGTPLYLATRRGFYNIVKLLLDRGASINKTGPGNDLGSALMVACAEGHTEIVKLFLSRGASLEVEGSQFLSAQGTARTFRKEEVLKILEEHSREGQPEGHHPQTEEAPDEGSGGEKHENGLPDGDEVEELNTRLQALDT